MHVTGIMLVKDRPGYQRFMRCAIACWDAQTHADRSLVIVAPPDLDLPLSSSGQLFGDGTDRQVVRAAGAVGELRNIAVERAQADSVIVHWDDDDWSYYQRIAQQVSRIEAGHAITGYHSMLFVDQRTDPEQVWEYSGHPGMPLGTSLMYRREVWEAKPFPATSMGEETRWLMGLPAPLTVPGFRHDGGPMMLARIHGANTSSAYLDLDHASEFSRAPQYSWLRFPA